jgi:hypothetical protein
MFLVRKMPNDPTYAIHRFQAMDGIIGRDTIKAAQELAARKA